MAERATTFGKAVCESLGIDPEQVRTIQIRADAEDILEIKVTLIPSIAATQALTPICKALADDPKVVRIEAGRPIMDVTSLAHIYRQLESAVED
jgi:hypothetical protein